MILNALKTTLKWKGSHCVPLRHTYVHQQLCCNNRDYIYCKPTVVMVPTVWLPVIPPELSFRQPPDRPVTATLASRQLSVFSVFVSVTIWSSLFQENFTLCQNWVRTGPMLVASARYWPRSGPLWQITRDRSWWMADFTPAIFSLLASVTERPWTGIISCLFID